MPGDDLFDFEEVGDSSRRMFAPKAGRARARNPFDEVEEVGQPGRPMFQQKRRRSRGQRPRPDPEVTSSGADVLPVEAEESDTDAEAPPLEPVAADQSVKAAQPGPKPAPEDRPWYEDLARGYLSYGQGAYGNLLDDFYSAIGMESTAQKIRESAAQYPGSQVVGQMAGGVALSALAPATKLAQGLVGGAYGAASEYGASGNPLSTAAAGGIGLLSGVGGAWAGDKVARWLATRARPNVAASVDDLRNAYLAKHGSVPAPPTAAMTPDDPVLAAQRAGMREALDAPVPAPTSLPAPPSAASVDPQQAQRAALLEALDAPEPGLPGFERPRDFYASQLEPIPSVPEPPRPQPMPPPSATMSPTGYVEEVPEALRGLEITQPKVIRGEGGRFGKPAYPVGGLDMTPPPVRGAPMPPEPRYGPEKGREWLFEYDALEAAGKSPRPRVGGRASPNLAEELAAGRVDAPLELAVDPATLRRTPAPVPAPTPDMPLELAGTPAREAVSPDYVPPYLDPKFIRDYERSQQDLLMKLPRETPLGAEDMRGGLGGLGRTLLRGYGLVSRGPTGYAARLAAGSSGRAAQRTVDIAEGRLLPNQTAGGLVRGGASALKEYAEPVAYADMPTLEWSISSVMHEGVSSMRPEDQAAMSDAIAKGDQQKIKATDFKLRQRYPEYARRVERALKALQGD